jgi:hypothetical protein
MRVPRTSGTSAENPGISDFPELHTATITSCGSDRFGTIVLKN